MKMSKVGEEFEVKVVKSRRAFREKYFKGKRLTLDIGYK